MQPKYTVPTILLFSLVLFSACGGHQPVDLTAGKNTIAPIFKLGTVEAKSLSSFIKLPGQLKPFEEVNIFPKVSSFVKEVKVDRGSAVHKGEVLMVLEAPELEGQLQAARSKYAQAEEMFAITKEHYDRLKEASNTSGSVALMELSNAKSKMKADSAVAQAEKANVGSLQDMVNYLTVRAPFDGAITERNVHPGALVGPSAKAGDLPMLVLQQLAKLRLEAFIPEVYAGKVDLNKQVMYQLNAFPGKEFTGKISRSSNSLNSTIRSEAVELDVVNDDHNNLFKPGMYAEVRIPLLSSAQSLIVPATAVITSTERKYVVTVKDGKAHLIDVKEGIAEGDFKEIFGDIHPGETIVVNASDEIKEGTAIK